MSKRSLSPSAGGALVKRAKATPPPSNQIAISSTNDDRNKGLIRTVQRTSNLEAPIVSLAGAHSVYFTIWVYILYMNDTLYRAKF
jgi:Prp8 binding protein